MPHDNLTRRRRPRGKAPAFLWKLCRLVTEAGAVEGSVSPDGRTLVWRDAAGNLRVATLLHRRHGRWAVLVDGTRRFDLPAATDTEARRELAEWIADPS
jgi:hypothetical protein